MRRAVISSSVQNLIETGIHLGHLFLIHTTQKLRMLYIHPTIYVVMRRKQTYCLRSIRNCKFNAYVSYYEGGVSSCYFWDKDDGGFATAWLVRKSYNQS